VDRLKGRVDRIVVTGGAGFVGSHLVDRLVAEGAEVLVIDDLSTGRAEAVVSAARLERLDVVTDGAAAAVARFRPGTVYHLAAQASVPASMRDPMRDLAVNVGGTYRMAEAARIVGARLVFVSSGGAIYGECPRPAREATRPAPSSYYGVHKLTAEAHVALSGVDHAIARPSNVYGPHQAAGLEGAVVSAFMAQARSTGVLTIDGDGHQVRDFIHVADVVAALILLGDLSDARGVWNVSSGRATSITGLADLVERAWGKPLGRRHSARRAGDVRLSRVASPRLRAAGWRPAVSLRRGLAELAQGASLA